MKRQLSKVVNASGADGVILSYPSHIRWACGLVSSNALLYIDAERRVMATDSRYAEAAKVLDGVDTVIARPGEPLAAALYRSSVLRDTVAFQAEHVTVAELKQWEAAAPEITLKPTTGLLDPFIAVKQPEEITAIAKAQRITDSVFEEVIPLLKPGVTEREIAAEIVSRQLAAGAEGIHSDFWPMVAFGARSALPHSVPGETRLRKDDVVMLDYGCTVGGYCSDMTRMVAVGSASDEYTKVYEIVRRAQEAGLAALKAAATGAEADAPARAIITDAGFGKYFGHSLGHGVGLDVHEWPVLNGRNTKALPAGAVITVEPGIYLPGKFGVRIEDMVVIEDGGARNLTESSKDLLVV